MISTLKELRKKAKLLHKLKLIYLDLREKQYEGSESYKRYNELANEAYMTREAIIDVVGEK